jgi:hypothetical protein
MNWQAITIAIVAGALILMAVGSIASTSTGHFIKDHFNGTFLEQPGGFLVDVGSSLMHTLVTVLMFMLGAGVILVGIYLKFHP